MEAVRQYLAFHGCKDFSENFFLYNYICSLDRQCHSYYRYKCVQWSCVIYTLNIYRVSFQDLCSVEILNRIGTSLRAECKFVISI